MVKNSYPSLPVVAFRRTKIEMPIVVCFAKTLIGKYSIAAVRMAYAIFRNESGNGKYGVNNNYGGIQADVGVWSNVPGTAIATCVKIDSGGDLRRFLCFKDEDGYKISFEWITAKVAEREMIDAKDYFKKWVGKTRYNAIEYGNFESLLRSASKVLSD